MADRHLEAAAEALRERGAWSVIASDSPIYDNLAHAAVTAYLDSLLGELPEEALEAGRDAARSMLPHDRGRAEVTIGAALRCLRDSLAGDAAEGYGASPSGTARKGPGAGRSE